MEIHTEEKYEKALEEIWILMQIQNPTQEEIDRINELADAIHAYEEAKWGWDKE